MPKNNTLLLAGDIGGTKTTLAIFSNQAGHRAPLEEATFSSVQYPNLSAIIEEFLSQIGRHPKMACFGVAGPVVDGHARITNLPWEISELELQKQHLCTRVYLINDLMAVAAIAPILPLDDLHTIHSGRPEKGGSLGIVAPGTGLGEAFLVWCDKIYKPFASEGGHTDFAPSTDLEIALLQFMNQNVDHVSYEKVCSGAGIPNLYKFLRAEKGLPEPKWLTDKLAQSKDPTPVIIDTAVDSEKSCPVCRASLELFVKILGKEAGNMALKVMATGGIFLGGGIPSRIVPALDSENFRLAFQTKGRLSHILKQIPVNVIINQKAALFGAALYGLERNQP